MSAPLTFLTDDELALAAPRRLPLRQTSPIRCPGGKAGQQVLDLSKFVPGSFGDLYEPFMGGMNMSLLLLKERRLAASRCHASECGAGSFLRGSADQWRAVGSSVVGE